jgi:nicotinate phosphoribosyltransferase
MHGYADFALFTDLYELTMVQAFVEEGMHDVAVFDLFCRKLPAQRNHLLACGLDDALSYLEQVRFTPEAIDFLRGHGGFNDPFLQWLGAFRFTGEVRAVPEGTAVFAGEPMLQVIAPLPEAQLVEPALLNQITFQTVLASKAARVVAAARGRGVVDFGMRRMHGVDAAMKAARAFYIAGVSATSNVLAGSQYGIPISGTMAHSYIEAHEDELEAFRRFAEIYPETILLVDTYDTLEGVRKVIALAGELGESFRVKGIRLDSGDLGDLARRSRRLLDEAGLKNVQIFASGGLDERQIVALLDRGAPIDAFGVGTRMGVSSDAPSLDTAYKLVAYAGRGRMKLSTEKATLPDRKQVFRVGEGGGEMHDVIALSNERLDGRPLLRPVMKDGQRLPAGREDLQTIRERAGREIEHLPARLRALEPAEPAYPVRISDRLKAERDRLRRALSAAQ